MQTPPSAWRTILLPRWKMTPLLAMHCIPIRHLSQASTNELVKQYTDASALAERYKAETAVERAVLRNFYLAPVQLELAVGELQGRLDALAATQ